MNTLVWNLPLKDIFFLIQSLLSLFLIDDRINSTSETRDSLGDYKEEKNKQTNKKSTKSWTKFPTRCKVKLVRLTFIDRKHTYHPHSTKAIDTNSLFAKRHLLFQLSLLVFQRFNLLKNHRELHVSYNPSSQRSGSYTCSLGNLDKKEFLAITINNVGAVIAWVDWKQSLFLTVSWEASQREKKCFFLFCIKIN